MAYYRKRGDKWSFTVDVGRDPVTNERIQKTRSGYSTKREAEKACAELVTEYERGNLSLRANKDTLGVFMKSYLETTLVNEIRQSTYEAKIRIMNNHIIPKLGHLKMQKITPLELQKFYNELELNPGTIQNVNRLMNQTLRTAVEWGYIIKNVNTLVKKPTYRKKAGIKVWTKDQYEVFLEVTKGTRFHPFYMIELNCGLRPGETFALSWDQIQFKQKTIRVERTVVYTKKDGIVIQQYPKNDASFRNISMPDSLVKYLMKLKLEQPPNPLNLVIPGIKSEIVYNSTINKALKVDIGKSNLPFITPHDLRHTHATYLLSHPPFGLGLSVKAVSERLGHAKATTTLNTYSHVLPNMQESVAESIEKNVRKTVDN